MSAGPISNTDIAAWRQKIDDIDKQLVVLLSRRAEAAKAIGELKRGEQIPIYEPKREEYVFEHVKSINPGPMVDSELISIYERLMDVMRTLQRANP